MNKRRIIFLSRKFGHAIGSVFLFDSNIDILKIQLVHKLSQVCAFEGQHTHEYFSKGDD